MNFAKVTKKVVKAGMAAVHGPALDAAALESALKKAERWMRNAYGSVDWDELTEGGTQLGTLEAFYQETLKDTSGGTRTFNNESRRNLK
jgi:hypothetical protein